MIIYILSYFALAVAVTGLIVSIISLVKRFCNKTQSITDANYKYLNSDSEQIKNVSMKYGARIRGSVRLSQGRIKSMDEIKMKESAIHFP